MSDKTTDKQAGGARVRLNRQKVISAAFDLANEDGIDALSMRRLGEKLGVKAMSLYNHVRGKEDLLSAIADNAVMLIELPEDGSSWRDDMQARAVSARAVLLKHPWACALFMSNSMPGGAMLGYIDRSLAVLRSAGFSIELADHALNLLDSYIYGFTMQELNYPFEMKEVKKTAAGFIPMLQVDFPALAELTAHIVYSDYKDAFEGVHDFQFGLQIILDGLEARLSA